MDGSVGSASSALLVEAIDGALPQTQCTRCGYPDCRRYAEAVVAGEIAINRCPPGGAEGIGRLARLTDRPIIPLDVACGVEAPRSMALIDESACIGCTLCISPCPVDCIVGAPKAMHRVIDEFCTGCALCLPACPVDCISLVPVTGERTGWQAWTPLQADTARARYTFHQMRKSRDEAHVLGSTLRSATAGSASLDERSAPIATPTLRDSSLGKGSRHDLPDADTAGAHQGNTTEALSPERKRALIDAALQRARAARTAR